MGSIVAVDAVPSRDITLHLAESLRADGHAVRVFGDAGAFLSERSPLLDSDVLFALGSLRCTRDLLAAAPRLRGVVSPFIGTDGFDEAAATDLGILVANGHAPENVEGMAEATVLLMLAAAYDLAGAVSRMDGISQRRDARALARKTVGLIGFGRIAQAVQRRLASWNVRFLIAARRPPEPLPEHAEYVQLDELLAYSDIVSVHTSLTPETRHLIGEPRLRTLRPDAIFVNAARGAIVDEAALARVAAERPDLRFALDTFEREPLAPDSPLRGLPNVILTPHCIGHTSESAFALRELAVENVRALLAGRQPPSLRNPSALAAWLPRWSNCTA